MRFHGHILRFWAPAVCGVWELLRMPNGPTSGAVCAALIMATNAYWKDAR